MRAVPREVTGIYHPCIEHMYIKETPDTNHKMDRTLIIETLGFDEDDEGYDSHMIDLLADLDDLKNQVQAKASKFSNIEIRTR